MKPSMVNANLMQMREMRADVAREYNDLPLLDALEACLQAMQWLNEKKDAPMRAKLYHASIAVQRAIAHLRASRKGEGK